MNFVNFIFGYVLLNVIRSRLLSFAQESPKECDKLDFNDVESDFKSCCGALCLVKMKTQNAMEPQFYSPGREINIKNYDQNLMYMACLTKKGKSCGYVGYNHTNGQIQSVEFGDGEEKFEVPLSGDANTNIIRNFMLLLVVVVEFLLF